MSFEPVTPAVGRALTIIRPYPEMDAQIVSLLQGSGDPMKEYAAARIAKLEGDLAAEREAHGSIQNKAAIRIRELEDLKTPWRLYIDRPDTHAISSFEPTYNIRDDEGDFVVCDIPKDRAERIIACVNALSGLNPEAIPALLDAAQKMKDARGPGDSATAGWYAEKALDIAKGKNHAPLIAIPQSELRMLQDMITQLRGSLNAERKALDGINPDGIKELVAAVKLLANGDNYNEPGFDPVEIACDALAKVKKEA